MSREHSARRVKEYIKSAGLHVGALPGMRSLFRPLLRSRATIFVLHRFRNPDLGTEGHDPALLRRVLGLLRRMRCEILDLTALFQRVATGEPPLRGAVAFTIDDGYVEQATIAAPVFAEFDCPVTTFVTTGFLDGTVWFWWDQIEYVLRRTTHRSVTVELNSSRMAYDLGEASARQRAYDDLVARCKEIDDAEMRRAIRRLAESAEVALPPAAPAEFAPMTWDQLRVCERGGMTFGPHTVTHPVLSQLSDVESASELTRSWDRVRAEAHQPIPVFCYPNGRLQDAGPREVETLIRLRFKGALLGEPGYARFSDSDQRAIYRVPRFAFTDSVPDAMQCVSGLEQLKQLVRRRADTGR